MIAVYVLSAHTYCKIYFYYNSRIHSFNTLGININTSIYYSLQKLTTDDDENAPKQQRAYYTDEQLIETIDYLLKSMDMNGDGYIDYTEYKMNSD